MSFLLRGTALAVSCAMSFSSLGCTLLGLGVGSAIPKASETTTPMPVEAVPPGSDVTVVYYRPVDERGGGFLRIDGTYRGTEDGKAIVERGTRSYLIPVSRIQETQARLYTSNYITKARSSAA
jgi:hypothetical protein